MRIKQPIEMRKLRGVLSVTPRFESVSIVYCRATWIAAETRHFSISDDSRSSAVRGQKFGFGYWEQENKNPIPSKLILAALPQ
jgi:hypothetical protein